MESQVEWVVPFSLKRLLTVLWHMDNPTRNQSLHSYWGNRWANMFPGGCPYYSGASRPPGDSRARWNWGVVTTEWTGNELLQDKWAATWEMRNPLTKSTEGEWQHPLTLFCLNFIPVYVSQSVNDRGCEWLHKWMNSVRILWDAEKDTKQTSSNLLCRYKPDFRSIQRDSDTAFSELHEITWYMIVNLSNYRVQPPLPLFFWFLFLKPADLLWH